jgi:hypothetical protein
MCDYGCRSLVFQGTSSWPLGRSFSFALFSQRPDKYLGPLFLFLLFPDYSNHLTSSAMDTTSPTLRDDTITVISGAVGWACAIPADQLAPTRLEPR